MVRPRAWLALAALITLPACVTQDGPPFWSVRHADSRNTDAVDIAPAAALRPAWFFGPDVPIGTYVAVGRNGLLYTHSYGASDKPAGPNAGCRLWALHAHTGTVAWCSREVGPALTSLALGRDNSVYVADTDELFRFSGRGRLLWRRAIPSETSGLTWVRGGGLLLADYAGNVTVYDPADGKPLTHPFRLPAAPYPRGEFTPSMASGQLQAGVGTDYLPRLLDNFFGYGIVIKDMPAVEPRSGRIFIAANSADGRSGALWGLEMRRVKGASAELKIVCTEPIGANSDTSPAITADGGTLFTAAAGKLFAINTATCRKRWALDRPGVAAASPTVTGDGRIYLMAGGSLGGFVDEGARGRQLWSLRAADRAKAEGFPGGVFDSVVAAARGRLYVTATYGHERPGWIFPLAHRLFVVDADKGTVLDTVDLGAESDSTPSIGPDGWVYVPTKSLSHAHAISLGLLSKLPPELSGLPLSRPRNGVYAFRPGQGD
jgi:outer membrane protein assembly factor BamB